MAFNYPILPNFEALSIQNLPSSSHTSVQLQANQTEYLSNLKKQKHQEYKSIAVKAEHEKQT